MPLGITNHDAQNENCQKFTDINELRGMAIEAQGVTGSFYVSFCDLNGNLLLNGTGFITGLSYCQVQQGGGPTTVIWSLDVPNKIINITIL